MPCGYARLPNTGRKAVNSSITECSGIRLPISAGSSSSFGRENAREVRKAKNTDNITTSAIIITDET